MMTTIVMLNADAEEFNSFLGSVLLALVFWKERDKKTS